MYKQNYYLDYHPCLLRYTVEFKILFADPQFRDPRSKDQFVGNLKGKGRRKKKNGGERNLKRWTNIYRWNSCWITTWRDKTFRDHYTVACFSSNIRRVHVYERVCTREGCIHAHTCRNKDRRLPFIRTKITGVLISSRSIHLPPPRQSHFPPLSTFTVRGTVIPGSVNGNGTRETSIQHWRILSGNAATSRFDVFHRSFLPFNQNIQIILSSRKSFTSKDSRCRP